jgi:hypothetical protein
MIEPDQLPDGLMSFLQTEATDARDTSLDELRAIALDFYNGEPFGGGMEVAGRSQYVSRDTAEVVDYMTETVLELFVSGDNAVEFEHGDKALAKVVTAVLSRDFMRKQDGYNILLDALKSGLLEKTGAIKSFIKPAEYRTVEEEIDPAEFEAIEGEVLGVEPIEVDGEVQSLRVQIRKEISPQRFCDAAIPNEELDISRDTRDLETSPYIAHVTEKTISEIKMMGYDTDGMSGDMPRSTTLSDARGSVNHQSARSGVLAKVQWREEHIMFDADGDGYAERLIVERVDDRIFSIKESDCHYFTEWCPYRMPHRRVGQSMADKSMDIQLVRSILTRQALDNIYSSNVPRILMHEDSIGVNTIDDLMDQSVGAPLRWKGVASPQPFSIPFVAGEAFNAIQLFSDERERRTGVSAANQGLDRDVLNKTATGAAMQMSQGRGKEMFLARNFAEFFSRVMRKKYKLMREYGDPIEIEIDGETVTTDPKQWPDEMEVSIRVGMGTGRKEDRIQNLTALAQLQAQAQEGGLSIVSEENIFNTGVAIVENMSLGKAEAYWTKPEGGQPPKRDPNEIEAETIVAKEEVKAKAAYEGKLKSLEYEWDIGKRRIEMEAMLGLLGEGQDIGNYSPGGDVGV